MNPNDQNLGSSSRRAKCKRRAEPSKPSFKVDVTHTGFPPQYPPDYDVEISPKGFCITITHPQAPQPGSSSQAPQPFPYQSFPYQPFPNPQFPPTDWGTPYQPQYVPNYQPVQEEDTSDEGELSPTTQQEEDIKFYTAPHGYLWGKKLKDTMKRKDEIKAKYGLYQITPYKPLNPSFDIIFFPNPFSSPAPTREIKKVEIHGPSKMCLRRSRYHTNVVDYQKSRTPVLCLFKHGKYEERRCGFIRWFDPPMCNRSVEIIPGLLCSKNLLEAKIRKLEHEARRWKLLLLITWVLFPTNEQTCVKLRNIYVTIANEIESESTFCLSEMKVKLDLVVRSKSSPSNSKNHVQALMVSASTIAQAKGYVPLLESIPTAVKI
ncbi:hypothetical protein OSB04_un001813 [Centaurea solstitialis]|uniref:Uncharacterized protein n=1 Tax=Centaurea solstitialis TaxID=347529 RepID=A0AA38S1G3_9ASTR|nr:hypothetical protein OSB04_un001813 [Centaurea solstitialis]